MSIYYLIKGMSFAIKLINSISIIDFLAFFFVILYAKVIENNMPYLKIHLFLEEYGFKPLNYFIRGQVFCL